MMNVGTLAARVGATEPETPGGLHGDGRCPHCGGYSLFLKADYWSCTDCGRGSSDLTDLVAAIDGIEIGPDAWGTYELPSEPTPTEIPVDALPPVLRDHVESVAAAMQVPVEFAAMLALLSVSATVAGKAVVRIDGAWTEEWVAIYGAMILPPGERKSSTFAAMTAPIREWERQHMERIRPIYLAALDNVRIAEKRLEAAIKQAVKGGDHEVEAERLHLEEAKAKVPPLGRLLLDDATPEAIVQFWGDNDERAAILSPEGDQFRMFDGRYSDGKPRLNEAKKAWSGEQIISDRASRDMVRVERPALTLGVCLQPAVIESLGNARVMRGEGLMARILWLRPASNVGHRSHSGAAPTINELAARRYTDLIHRLMDMERGQTLQIAPDALPLLYAYMDELEAAKRPHGGLAGIIDWAEKAHGQAVRIAAILHLASEPETTAIGPDIMADAIRITRALTDHARAVYAGMGRDEWTRDLQDVLSKITELGEPTTRDVFNAMRGRRSLSRMVDLLSVLEDLAARGIIRVVTQPSTGGRQPSPKIQVHPELSIRKSRKSLPQKTSADSADAYHGNGTKTPDTSAGSADAYSVDDLAYERAERLGMAEA